MTGYTKLFGSILDSSIWRESKETRLVWITMLAMCDRDGTVSAAVPGLADRAKVSLEECLAALKTLSEPDPWSRSADHEGRRIQAVDGGWKIINHEKYRNKMSLEDRREYYRKKKQEYRDKQRTASKGMAAREIIKEQTDAREAAERDLS